MKKLKKEQPQATFTLFQFHFNLQTHFMIVVSYCCWFYSFVLTTYWSTFKAIGSWNSLLLYLDSHPPLYQTSSCRTRTSTIQTSTMTTSLNTGKYSRHDYWFDWRLIFCDHFDHSLLFLFVSRHVVLPKDIAKLVPKTHLMTETEWRGLGVQQSHGWIHYMIHEPEPHILLFRRPVTGGIPPTQEEQFKNELE